jgi:hypothetical protein
MRIRAWRTEVQVLSKALRSLYVADQRPRKSCIGALSAPQLPDSWAWPRNQAQDVVTLRIGNGVCEEDMVG